MAMQNVRLRRHMRGPHSWWSLKPEGVVIQTPLDLIGCDSDTKQNTPSLITASDLIVKELLVQVKPERDRAHDEDVQVMTRLEELEHRLAEAGDGTLFGPAVLPGLVPVAADLHGLLEVGRFGTQLCDLICVGGLGDALASNLDVAPVRARVLPCEL